MAGKSAKTKNWTPDELVAFYQRQGKPVPSEAAKLLEALGLKTHLRPPTKAEAGTTTPDQDPGTVVSAKRKGVNVNPILASLKAPLIYSAATDQPSLTLWFDGARLLTVNELFSIQQYRKHAIFPYKKAWKTLVAQALLALPKGQTKPRFEGPTRIWLYRRGKKRVDLDSLPTMFKYTIDALRDGGVIPDDNPDIIVEPRLLQEKGLPAVAIRLERLWDWETPDLEDLKKRWLG